ncbi:Peptide-N4-(N-acetyl-beta-glucosaminyl)asparagine amidase A [Vitis vinifera]|uniref:Peptide-N4-(N-acetyl-beta-glucosaminyl)asparagine amidase A n=1 Tax=Vitis vinifera TaxID=29760 RepID=A0A438E5E1_VITVI|nr:Peptide-N4-(N-acetyl-beta-glucosaminyl)asparagine amidase A [Vitis vinifera]
MAASLLPLLLFSLFFLLNPPSTTANLHKVSNLLRSQLLSQPKPHRDTPPIRFFEVTKPIKVPKTKPCSSLVLQHDFGYTYGKPLFLLPTLLLLIAHLRISPKLCWNGVPHVKGGNLIGFLGFGLVGLSFSGAALQSLQLLDCLDC